MKENYQKTSHLHDCTHCAFNYLGVTCGCSLEAKHHEYRVEHQLHTVHQAASDHEHSMNQPAMAAHMEHDLAQRFFISLGLTIPIFMISTWPKILEGLLDQKLINLILLALTTPCVFWTGSIFLTGAYFSLKEKKLNMSVLIATGVSIAYFASIIMILLGSSETFFEASAMLVTFVLFGHWMEMKARRGTSDALKALFQLIPAQAHVLRNGKEVTIKAAELVIGDTVILKPGEKIPIDGVITQGRTTIDESLITGESNPVVKTIGDPVIGGSLNQMGSIQFKVTHSQNETALAHIIKLVEKAQYSKTHGQKLADVAAAVLVVIAILSGLITFFAWLFFAKSSFTMALSFAVSSIVVACPDALGLAIPTAVAVGTGMGALHNILIKDASSLEEASKINVIFLDKTGTLTEGKPVIESIRAIPHNSEHDVLYYAASVQHLITHPLTDALIQKALEKSIHLSSHVQNVQALEGIGIQATVDNKTVIVGTPQLFKETGMDIAEVTQMISQEMDQGKSISLVSVDNKIIGAFSAHDAIKKTAKQAIIGIKEMGIVPVMLTGDNQKIAQKISHELGISRFFAGVRPEQKSDYVKQFQAEGNIVAMVGDGINDAPALAQANVGIAIGSGTDVARESASIILMKSDPIDILNMIVLSKATVRKMKQNLFWAAGYNIVTIPLAAGLFYHNFGWSLRPEISALLMSMSSIIVALNAVSLKFQRLYS